MPAPFSHRHRPLTTVAVVFSGLAALIPAAAARAADGTVLGSRWAQPPELQLHGGVASDPDVHADRSFGNLRARWPTGLGLSAAVDLKWSVMPLSMRFSDAPNSVHWTEDAHRLYGRVALGWRNRHTDVLAGIGLERDGWRPYLRWTSAFGSGRVRAGLLDGGPWTQAGDIAHLGVGSDLYDIGVPVEVDMGAIMRANGDVVPEVALSGWPATWWVRLTLAARLSPPNWVVALQHAPRVGDDRARALAPVLEALGAAPITAMPSRANATRLLRDAEGPAAERTLDLAAAFPKDRVFTWILQGMTKIMHRCWVVERESLRNTGKTLVLVRLACTDDGDPAAIAGPDGPILLRTGCHLIDEAGLWRLPACPSALPVSSKRRPALLLPLRIDLPNSAAWFVRLGPLYLHDRSFTVSGDAVSARCADGFLPGVTQLCASPSLGWMWARTTDGRTTSLAAVGHEALNEPRTLARFSGPEVACRLDSACAVLGHCYPYGDSCVALHDNDCATSMACTIAGQCAAEGGNCVARNSETCVPTPMCEARGRCTARGGRCVADSQEGCATTAACLAHGRCSKVGHECAVGSDADCQRHEGCLSEGLCAKVANTCQAGHDGHCAASAACSKEGRCVATGGACVAARGQP